MVLESFFGCEDAVIENL